MTDLSTGNAVVHTSSGVFSARGITVSALLAALLAACAVVPAVPLGPVPITLQTFVVVLAALLLTPGEAALSMGVFLLLGAAGLPVFSGLHGGIPWLAGPTGGFLFGFFFGAITGSLARTAFTRGGKSTLAGDILAAAVVLLVIYVLGSVQLGLSAHLDAAKAIALGVLPFVIGDVAKSVVAIAVAKTVRRVLPAR